MTRVIKSRHGDLRENQMRGGEAAGRGGRNGWWKKVVGLVEESEGGWIWDNLRLKVGDGRVVYKFWTEFWVGDKSLKVLFPRLFNLSIVKKGTVQDMGRWVDDRW